MLVTLTAAKTKQAYRTALQEFLAWLAECGEPLSLPVLESWRSRLLERLSVSSVNQRLSAVRLFLRQAAERGSFPREEMLRLSAVSNVRQPGQRLGRWLTAAEAGRLLGVPDSVFGQWLLGIGIFNLIAGYVSAIALGTIAAARRGRLRLAAHALMMPVYWLGISFAAYRALWQLISAPYHWEKTEHVGIRSAPPPTSAPQPAISGEEAQSVARDALAH